MAQNKKYREGEGYEWDDFRKNLKSLMDSRGLTGKDFAEEVGLAPTTVTRYLTERTPEITALWKICDHWNVSIDWLIGREDSRYAELPDSVKKMINAYTVASPEDKAVIDMILRKYEK